MKKFLLVLVLFAIIATGTVFADHSNNKLGIGVMGGWYGGWGTSGWGHAALSLKLPSIPIFWGISFGLGENHFYLGIQGDNYFYEGALVPQVNLHWFVGLGAWINVGGFGDNPFLSLGARIPLGLSWHIVDFLEVFLDIAPSLGLQVLPSVYFPAGGWPLEIGIRLWF